MKKNIYIYFTLTLASIVLFGACSDDEFASPIDEGFTPVTAAITGSDAVDVTPLTVRYSVPTRASSTFAWSVSSGTAGAISGNADGNSVDLVFTAEGTITLQVIETNTGGAGDAVTLDIVATAGTPSAANIFTESTIPVRSGQIDTVVVSFNREMATAPTAALTTGAGIETLGSLGQATGQAITAANASVFSLTGADSLANGAMSAYFWIYTAGTGDGTPGISVTGGVANAAWGGTTQASASTGSITTIDNTAPSAADISYSSEVAKNGDDITVTVTFSEPMDATASVSIDWAGNSVAAFSGNLAVDSDNTAVWTTTYSAPAGDDAINFVVTGARDLAGNGQNAVADATLVVDNTAPAVSGAAAAEFSSSVDWARLNATSSENGTLYYIIVADGVAVADQADVQNPNIGVENGSASASAGVSTTIDSGVLAAGSYDVYFFAKDAAENEGTVVGPTDLTID